MKLPVLARCLHLAANLWLLAACSEGAAGFSSYDGDAYPNRRPRLENEEHALAYVANRLSDSVSVIDLDAQILLGNAPVGRDPVDVDGPRHVVLDRAAGLAYVVYSYPNSNVSPHASSLGGNGRLGYVAALSLSDLRPLGELRLDVTPAELALSSDGARLAVSHYDTLKALDTTSIEARRANVALIDPASKISDSTASATRVSVCAVPAALAFGKNDQLLFVACTGEDSLAVLDAVQGTLVARVPAGSGPVNQPYALSRDAAGERLLLSNQVAGSVAMFSTEDAPELLSLAVLTGVPLFAEFSDDASQFVVALQNPDGCARVDSATGTVLATRSYTESECVRPSQPRRLRDGRWILVCQGDGHTPGTLVALDPETLAVSSPLELGILPERVEILEP